MAAGRLRRLIRALHILAAALLGTYLYAPLTDAQWLLSGLQYGVFPALALSGLAMWQHGRLHRLFGARRTAA
jgi:hypothetical protein